MIEYLTAGDIYSINESVVGKRPYVRDRHLLRSAARRPMIVLFGEEQFPTLMEKAAALLHALAYHHLFEDGNKRTATIAVTRFLNQNGYTIMCTPEEFAHYVLQIAQNKHEISDVAIWLEAHTRET